MSSEIKVKHKEMVKRRKMVSIGYELQLKYIT